MKEWLDLVYRLSENVITDQSEINDLKEDQTIRKILSLVQDYHNKISTER